MCKLRDGGRLGVKIHKMKNYEGGYYNLRNRAELNGVKFAN